MERDDSKRSLTGSEDEFESYDESGSQTGSTKYKRRKLEKGSDEYQKRRERNNIAVKKSREKSRQKAKQTLEQVDKLRKENENLEQKVTILSKELGVLKDLFLAHAGASSPTPTSECTNCNPQHTTKLDISDHGYSSMSN